MLDLQPINLETLLHNLAPLLAMNIGERGVELVFHLAPDLPQCIIADGLRLQQILLNLSSNAIKFTPQGEVIVAVKLIEKKVNYIIIEFSIRDTGIGISPENIDGIFESFSQAETSITRRFGGTGLGFAICKKLVQLMGGELYVESTLHEGSHFYFQIQCKPAPPTKCINPLKNDNRLFLKCLLVDDNLTVRTVLGDTLRSFGWAVEEAVSSDEAIDKIMACNASKPLFVIDIEKQLTQLPSILDYENDSVTRILHTLKGLASTFGANDVASIASEMHQSFIKKNLSKKRWRVLLDALKHSSAEAIISARGILAQALPETVVASSTGTIELYAKLIAYLDEHNMKALDVYNQLPQHSESDAVLEKAMDQLDFVAAAARCREILVQRKKESSC